MISALRALGLAPLFVVLLVGAARVARADDEPPPPPDDAALVEAAKARFFAGLELFKAERWGAALAEFEESIRIHATRSAKRNAALCLRKLERYAEALAIYETLATDFPDVDEAERALRERETGELRALVGTIALDVSEQGAIVTIDGLERGVTPLTAPLRVDSGSHRVEAYKDGYLLESRQVAVAGKTTVELRIDLRPLAQSGRLAVVEKDGARVSVLVDNVRVGSTPWEGALAPGTHHVALRGEGRVGSEPAAAPVRLGEITRLSIGVEELAGEIAVHPEPASATVVIDGVEVGRGVWRGPLKLGPHRVELATEGFIPLERRLELVDGEPQVLRLSMERDRTSGVWQIKKQPRFVVDLAVGPAIGATFGGDVIPSDCDDACSTTPTYGALVLADAGYRFPVGISLGVAAGYLHARQEVEGRPLRLKERPDALRIDEGRASDALVLHGFLIGASVAFDAGESVFFRGRLTSGVTIASLRDERAGTWVSALDGTSYAIAEVSETRGAQYFAIVPDVHVGWRVRPFFEIGGTIHALGLIGLSSPPSWQNDADVHAPGFLGFFDEEQIASRALFLVAPALDATLSF